MTETKSQASYEFIQFISSYTTMIEAHVVAVRKILEDTVGDVMQGVSEISDQTRLKKEEADSALFRVYTEPDKEEATALNEVQGSVDNIFKSASMSDREAQEDAAVNSQDQSDAASIIENKLRRVSGKFSKHMEALSTLDDNLKEQLITMMGALSNDDVIGQRLEHICKGIHALNVAISHVMADYLNRCVDSEILAVKDQVLSYVYATYTTEEEKRLHEHFFPKAS